MKKINEICEKYCDKHIRKKINTSEGNLCDGEFCEEARRNIRGFRSNIEDFISSWENWDERNLKEQRNIFPFLDQIEDLPLTEKERKEQEELMDKIGIKGEYRNTARMILSTMPKKKQTIIDIVQAHEDACTGRDRIMKIARSLRISDVMKNNRN